jgi:HD-like signal output (HDOD) protein
VKRNRLGSKKAEDLVFIHTNLRLLSRKNDHYKEGATKLWDVAPECADLDATLHDLVTVGDGDDVSLACGASSISGTMLGSNDLSAVGDDNENVDFLANPYDSESNSD